MAANEMLGEYCDDCIHDILLISVCTDMSLGAVTDVRIDEVSVKVELAEVLGPMANVPILVKFDNCMSVTPFTVNKSFSTSNCVWLIDDIDWLSCSIDEILDVVCWLIRIEEMLLDKLAFE